MLENSVEHKPDNVTFYAAHLAAVETAVGTVIHAAHIPFGGHVLSLNEGAFLARASSECNSRQTAALACYEIAGVSATFKSLAPATKKLGPMLSIVMQGLLFTVGILFGGRGRFGHRPPCRRAVPRRGRRSGVRGRCHRGEPPPRAVLRHALSPDGRRVGRCGALQARGSGRMGRRQ